ncbi:MAG: glycosyltransferase [Fibrobacter sp.]|nr:glycosyltransferase [Fibrobacter sp.]
MKVLVVSHNSFSTCNSMGKTLCTLFSSFKKDEISQLYIYPTIPDIDFCNSYYRITDKDALNFFKSFKVKGKEIRLDSNGKYSYNLFENAKDESFYRNKKNHSAIRILARDLLWKITPWFNKNLKKWLDDQKITHIFVAPGGYRFIYDVALKCAKYLDVPIITYVCDEYFFVKKREKLLDRFHQHLLSCKIKQLMSKTSMVIVISNELKELYGPYFKVKAETVMTATSYKIQDKPADVKNVQTITYMGNVRCNRYVSLLEIGLALDEINKENNKNYRLKIYSAEKDHFILSELSKAQSIDLMGFCSGKDFEKVFFSAQTLLHVEAFDEKSIDYVKNSISTKIADSLASGIPMLAYGPQDVASIKHLNRNNCAFCIERRENLKEELLRYLNMSAEERSQIVENALSAARKYHDMETVGKKVYNLIAGVGKSA